MSHSRIRKLGLLKTVAGLVGIYLLWALGLIRLLERLLNRPRSWHTELSYLLVFAMTAPFVGFFVGLCELVTGKPFRLLESRWGRLREWQQGVFSFLLLCLAIGLLLLLLHLVTGHEFF